MPTPAPAPHPYVTEAEFLALPETTERVELLDGEVIVPPAPTWAHQDLVGRLYRLLSAWADDHPPAVVGLAPLDVRFGPDRILQRELFVLPEGRDAGAAGPVADLPALVVEVLSARPRRQVGVVTPEGSRTVTDELASGVCAGLRIPLAAVFG